METIYDWATVAVFGALIVLFLQRSTTDAAPPKNDSLVTYLVAGVGCAATNYLGNKGYIVPAVGLFVATLALIWYKLGPFTRNSQ